MQPARFSDVLASLIACLVVIPGHAAQAERALSASPNDTHFDPTRVLQIELRLDPKDWHALRVSHRDRDEETGAVLATDPYKYFKADLTIDGRRIETIGVRKKGYIGTAISTRPSLKVKLDEFVRGRRLDGLDMLTFNNNHQDESQARQWLAYSVMRRAGVPAPRCNLARVTVNGEHLGIYTHIESIRKPFIESQYQTTAGDLYEGYGGDFTTNRFDRIVHKWGEDKERAQLRKLLDLLQRPPPLPSTTPDEVARLIDFDSFLTFWAVTSLVNHWDSYPGNQNNVYLYRNPRTDRLHFIPWGADTAFSQSWQPHSVRGGAVLCRELWRFPEVQERYRREMRRLLKEVWNEEALLREVDRVTALTAQGVTRDAGEVHKSREQLRAFIRNRRQEVQAELDAPPQPFREWTARTGGTPPRRMEISGSFSTTMSGPSMTNLFGCQPGVGEARIEYEVGGRKHRPFTRFGVTAHPTVVLPGPLRRRSEYPAIRLVALDDSGKLQWNLELVVDPHLARPGATNLPINDFVVKASVTQGTNDPERQWRYWDMAGALDLDHFEMKEGAKVSGRFRLRTTAFEEEKKP